MDNWLTRIPSDKLLHYIVCRFLVVYVGGAARIFLPKGWALVIGVIAAICAAVLKEWFDKKNPDKGTFEWKDLIADGIGIIDGAVSSVIFMV